MKYKIYSFLLPISALIITGCIPQGAYDPYSFAPQSSNSFWKQQGSKSFIISSSCCLQQKIPTYDELKGKTLTLADLIDITLVNNPETKQTWANALAQAALYGQSLSPYLPEITGSGSYSRTRESSLKPTSQWHQTTVTPEMQLSYTIYDFGQRSYSSEKARQALFYSDFSHNQSLQKIVQAIMNAYYDYQYQKQYLTALEANLENAKMSLDAANQKFQTGVASVSDVTQATTSYLQNKINLIAQKSALETSYATLLNIAGIPSNLALLVQDMPENISTNETVQNVDQLLDIARKNRQDLFAAQANVESQKANVGYAKSQELPKLMGEFDIGKNFYPPHMPEAYHYTAEVTLSIPIFKGFYYDNAIRNAKANLEKTRALLDQTELAISKEVSIAHTKFLNSKDTLQCSLEYLASANLRFDITLSNYKVGTMNILDVISAQSSLADARAKKVNSQKDWFKALVDIAYATGSLCTNPSLEEKKP
ncbi:MAG: TolC family protein [Chlamydiota bacterium]